MQFSPFSLNKDTFSKRFWMTVSILGFALLAVFIPQLYDGRIGVAEAGDGSSGDPWTVCASGCDFTTLTSAFVSSSVQNGDYININASYSTSTETLPLGFNSKTDFTIDCQNSGAIVETGNTAVPTGATIQNCDITNSTLTMNASSTLTGNTFSTSTAVTVALSSGSDNVTITNNTGIQSRFFCNFILSLLLICNK